MRPKVKHIAVMTKNREKMVEFYQKIFGLEPKRGFGGAKAAMRARTRTRPGMLSRMVTVAEMVASMPRR